MQHHVRHLALLRRMFTEQEWLFLVTHPQFKLAVRESGDTLDEVERLATAGERLLWAADDEKAAALKRSSCDGMSGDPGKHLGPFEALAVQEHISGYVSDERCLACGSRVRRIITKPQVPIE